MTVVRVDALCVCDGCAKRFGVELEVAEDLSMHKDFETLVRSTIRMGDAAGYIYGVRGKQTVDRFPLSYPVTVQAGLILCDECSRKCDAVPVEGNLTRAQVNEALGLPEETT
jgi:hypothetical protein